MRNMSPRHDSIYIPSSALIQVDPDKIDLRFILSSLASSPIYTYIHQIWYREFQYIYHDLQPAKWSEKSAEKGSGEPKRHRVRQLWSPSPPRDEGDSDAMDEDSESDSDSGDAATDKLGNTVRPVKI